MNQSPGSQVVQASRRRPACNHHSNTMERGSAITFGSTKKGLSGRKAALAVGWKVQASDLYSQEWRRLYISHWPTPHKPPLLSMEALTQHTKALTRGILNSTEVLNTGSKQAAPHDSWQLTRNISSVIRLPHSSHAEISPGSFPHSSLCKLSKPPVVGRCFFSPPQFCSASSLRRHFAFQGLLHYLYSQ